jgi:cation diffusion facilitator family transporter
VSSDHLASLCHEHVFLDAAQAANERHTRIVIGLTASMTVVEIVSGYFFGSMALLADGWHMASHASALGLTAIGYSFARRRASDPRFTFGTGKVGELAGYTSALVLGLIAVLMAYESGCRLLQPVAISFDEAIAVAVVGLVVNLVSAFILRDPIIEDHRGDHHRDHNLRGAYLHVIADALTSLLAIAALTAGRFLGWLWMDPVMGIVGAVVISRWSFGLLTDTGRILLDMNHNRTLSEEIRRRIEGDPGTHITDLHVWRVGPGHFSAIVSLVTSNPRPPSHYRDLVLTLDGLSHITLEVNPRSGE